MYRGSREKSTDEQWPGSAIIVWYSDHPLNIAGVRRVEAPLKVTVERTPASEAVLNVELEWAELEAASNKAYQRLAKKYNVPGFRPGRAPRSTLERMLGKDAIYHEGLEDLIDSSYQQAIIENALTPLAQPTVDAPEIEIGQPYTFVARVPVLAPVTIGDYKAIRVAEPEIEIDEAEVQQTLDRIQQDQVAWQPADRPAQIGDKVTVDLTLMVGDRQISKLHDNEYELAEERHGIFSGMDAHIVGLSEGDHAEFTTTIPEDYANAELAGKEASYDVTVKAVKYRELPALDDELAKSIGDYSTIEEVREAIRQQLRQQKESEARRAQRDEALKALTEITTVDINPVLVEEEQDVMVREMRRSLEQSRISFEQYLGAMGKTEEEYRAEIADEARERVKRDLALNAVADAEGISIGTTDVQSWLDLLAAIGANKKMRAGQLSRGQRANIENRLRRDQAMSRLIEIATEGRGEPGTHPHDHEGHDHEGHDHEGHDHEDAERNASAAAAVGEAAGAVADAAPSVSAAPTVEAAAPTAEAAAPTAEAAAPTAQADQAEVPNSKA